MMHAMSGIGDRPVIALSDGILRTLYLPVFDILRMQFISGDLWGMDSLRPSKYVV